MKRIVSLALICVTLVMCLAAPVSAAESMDNAINVLDYCSAFGSGKNTVKATGVGGQGSFSYNLPHDPIVRYVDIVFTTVNGSPSSVVCGDSGRRNNLTILQLSSNMFRAYGAIPQTSNTLYVIFTNGEFVNDGIYYEIVSFYAYGHNSYVFPETGYLAVGHRYWASSFSYMADADSPATVYIQDISAEPLHANFVAYVYPENWRKYDYMDLYLQVRATAIDSITCQLDGLSIPFTLSYCDLSTGDWVPYSVVDGQVIAFNEIDSIYLMIELDFSNLPRSSTRTPQISINGQFIENNIGQFVSLVSVVGGVNSVGQDPITYWLVKIYSALGVVDTTISNGFSSLSSGLASHFNNLSTWLTTQTTAIVDELSSGFYEVRFAMSTHFQQLKGWLQTQTSTLEAAIRGDSSSGDQFKEDNSGLISGLDDISSSMDSVNRPSMGSIDADYSGDISDASVLMASLFSEVTGISWLATILMASCTVGLISYILYGKG